MKDKLTKLDRAIVNKMYLDIKYQKIQILTDEELEHFGNRRMLIIKLLQVELQK